MRMHCVIDVHMYSVLNSRKSAIVDILHYLVDVNECQQNPCKNGGVCNNVIGSFVCTCPVGFGGTDCSQGYQIYTFL